MSYFIGIDGGGTKTDCVVTDENLNVKYQCTGGPSNFLIAGTDFVSAAIKHLINECKGALKIHDSDIQSIVLGTTGAGRRSDAESMENAFKEYYAAQNEQIPEFYVVSDAEIALEGAFSGGPGSILIAGTGSIIYGKDEQGNIHRAGGFGRFIGDEGSGYSIGRKGLTAVARSYDGRGGETILKDLLWDKFSIKNSDELIISVYKNNLDIASVAKLVIVAAEQNDPACLRIVEEEAEELILHITAMKKKLNVENMHLALSGSLLTEDNFFAKTFLNKLNSSLLEILIKESDHNPAIGAVISAKKLMNKNNN